MNHHPSRNGRLAGAAGLVLALLLAACGGSGGDGTTPAPAADFEITSGNAACGSGGCVADSAGGDGGVGGDGGSGGGDGAGGGLGEMRNVTVTARKPDGTVLGSAALKDNVVSIYDRKYKGAFILEFKDDGSGKGAYFDEAIQYWVPLGSTTLHVLVPQIKHHVSANPLTEAAYQWALKTYGTTTPLTAAQMQAANDAMRDAFNARVPAAYRVNDVTNYAVAVPNSLFGQPLPNTNAGRYATLLAAMPRAALRFNPALLQKKPAIAFMQELVSDFLDDGVINASLDPADQEAYDVTLPSLMFDALLEVRDAYADDAQPVPTAAAPNLCFNTALFTVGSKWDLTYQDLSTESVPNSFSTEVTKQTTFQGKAALEVVIGTADLGVVSRSYFGTDLSAGLVFYGSEQAVPFGQPPVAAVRTVFTPPTVDSRYLLAVGQTLAIDSQQTLSFLDASGQVLSTNDPVPYSQTIKFVGYETVSVIAGTFPKACKYEITDNVNNTFEVQWLSSGGEGVPVRSQVTDFSNESTTTEELVSGTINGKSIVPPPSVNGTRVPRAGRTQ